MSINADKPVPTFNTDDRNTDRAAMPAFPVCRSMQA
jgi:hypothetical protein